MAQPTNCHLELIRTDMTATSDSNGI